MSNHVLIRFVSRFTVYFYNAIYFSTTFSTPCKRFIKNLCFAFTPSKHGLKRAIGQEMSTHDLIYRWQQFLFRLPCIDLWTRLYDGAGNKWGIWLVNWYYLALCISSLFIIEKIQVNEMQQRKTLHYKKKLDPPREDLPELR